MPSPARARIAAAARTLLSEPIECAVSARASLDDAIRHTPTSIARPLSSSSVPLPDAATRSGGVAGTELTPDNWVRFLLGRGWLNEQRFSAADASTRHAAVAALSAALSFPLTVAAAWPQLFDSKAVSGKSLRLCVVGARAEASLPVHFWRELALLTSATDLTVELCGPASAGHKPVPTTRKWASGTQQLELTRLEPPGFFHDSPEGRALLTGSAASVTDAFILFNPGLGEPGWERAWRGTVAALAASQRPLLFTAMGVDDAQRDAAFLASDSSSKTAPALADAPPYTANPWSSTLSDHDDAAERSNALFRVVQGWGATCE